MGMVPGIRVRVYDPTLPVGKQDLLVSDSVTLHHTATIAELGETVAGLGPDNYSGRLAVEFRAAMLYVPDDEDQDAERRHELEGIGYDAHAAALDVQAAVRDRTKIITCGVPGPSGTNPLGITAVCDRPPGHSGEHECRLPEGWLSWHTERRAGSPT